MHDKIISINDYCLIGGDSSTTHCQEKEAALLKDEIIPPQIPLEKELFVIIDV